jgi:hypothetical protein
MKNQVFVVVQSDPYDGTSNVEGVYATRELAEAYVFSCEEELAKDEMEGAYQYVIEASFLITE